MTRFVIYNKTSKSYLGIKYIDNVKKFGFYKGIDEGYDILTFESLENANLIAQILYDMKGYKSLVISEVKID